MCGLVGMAGNLDHTMRTKIFPDLLHACSARGRDSTGAIAIDYKQKATGAKMLYGPDYLLDSRVYTEQVERPLSMALLGHCRSKTIGGIDVKNAHPFNFKRVIGMHNGTLQDYRHLPGYSAFEVDSEILYHAINEESVEDVIPTISGAWCLTWYDKEENTINFLRNKERPLYFLWSHDGKTMFWASEPWMFGPVERKLKVLHPDTGDQEKDEWFPYTELPENTLWSFRLERNGADTKITQRPVKILEGKVHGTRWQDGGRRGSSNNADKKAWIPQGDGTYRLQERQGGQVADPFASTRQPSNVDGKSTKDELNDQLPPFGYQEKKDSQEDTGTIDCTGVQFLRNSVKGSETSKDSTTGSRSRKPTLSLVKTSSNGSQQSNSGEPSDDSKSTWTPPPYRSPSSPKLVSFREVAGRPYITDNIGRHEYSEEEFEQKTGAVCSFCEKPIGDLTEVERFIADDEFICTSCVKPTQLATIAKGKK